MWSIIFLYKKLKVYTLIFVLIGVAGFQPVMAMSYAPLEKSSYIAFPLLLAAYHLMSFLANLSQRLHLKLVGFAAAIAVSLGQPNELIHLFYNPRAYAHDLGLFTMLVVPIFLLFGLHFLKPATTKRWHDYMFWASIATYILAASAHFLDFYSQYISIVFITGATLLIGLHLWKFLSGKKTAYTLFALGFLIWVSIFIVNMIAQVHYYEIPLMLVLMFFSGALFKQQQVQERLLYSQQNSDLQQQVHTQQQTIHQQQEAIHEKDKIIRVKEKRLQTNKSILEKAGRRLKEKERVLKLQNQQITKSIEYARNIQDAILPTEQALQQFFKDYFVLFRPKDIVSGDFYWCSQVTLEQPSNTAIARFVYQTKKQYTFLAVVDCTGHGVPGAFMSMIGNTLLNEIVNEKAVYAPSQILETLHQTIRADLKQAHSGNNDGMDICLCRLEKLEGGKTEVLFAGAKRDLFCLHQRELIVVAGDRKSIGGTQKEEHRSFSLQKVVLDQGDRVYLTTDGLTDMAMGAKSRKSFGTKRLKSFIDQCVDKSIDEQYTLLNGLVEKYKAGTEQRDDILVLAIELQ
ncbi:PP2C family protein-serine/threonine phosphatase [Microscilla marina]|uniref:Serine/threonine protein kinases n=1 Tax=Microscilla marina ATCC 23134 TaxID=313606 RepID=A1ZTA9_MICM2|nr:SpoIIE family protein phosphatase [Microscilla marina]EAY26331.1 serine/threonine protein kinases [Microscilla marina ATCC 23134]